MGSMFRTTLLASALAFAVLGTSNSRADDAAGEKAPACFSAQQVHMITAILQPLSMGADEIARQLVEDEASPETVYSATRQLALIERMQRRLLASDVECPVAMDSMTRDFAVLERTYDAFANGSKEYGIDKVDSDKAQSLLANIAPIVAAFGQQLESTE